MNGVSAAANSTPRDILVICGPTAAGKSAVAMWLAEQESTAIISADSRQVYKGFDIGTAKPTHDEQRRVPHFGIDVADPTFRYSAAVWAESAVGWIDTICAQSRRPLVVGGTGLYLRALFEGLFEEPPLDANARASLAEELDRLELSELQRWTRALDPDRAHLGRTQLRRAIEIALLTGHRLSELHRERPANARWGAGRGLRPRYLLVDAGPMLAPQISARIDHMLNHGWPDEVRVLIQSVPESAPAWNATGYDAIRRMLRGEIARENAHEIVLIATRQYAKRQRTWFRHQLPAGAVTHLDSTRDDWRDVAMRWARFATIEDGDGRRAL
ncbi:MAG TPA: tRNA (adenosine(37)-N6)-dimethylallyltransferase MiaA [Gemmatimonadaceae bacterium]